MIDWYVNGNDLVRSSDNTQAGYPYVSVNAVSQEVTMTFTCWEGDWFFDTTFGVAYNNFKAQNKDVADLLMKDKLLSIDGVLTIVSFESTLDETTRFYSFTARYTTTDSTKFSDLRLSI